MNILFFTNRYWPDLGGVEKHINSTCDIFIRKGHKINLVTKTQGKDTSHKKVNIYRISPKSTNTSEKIHVWRWLWKNRRLIKDADIIHAHDVYWWYIPFKFIYPTKKSYITFHGFEGFPIKTTAIFLRKISEILADGNIIVGDYIKKWYHTHPDFIIYGGINPVKESKGDFRFKKNRKYMKIIFLGRLDLDTGILKYLEAINKLNKKLNIKFTIYGDGKYARQASKLGILHGFIENVDEKIKYADIVFSSSYLASMEAFNNKKPVISTYDNILKKDILEMSPWSKWITITKNPNEITNSVIDFYTNPENFRGKIENSYSWVKTKTWLSVANIYLKLWRTYK